MYAGQALKMAMQNFWLKTAKVQNMPDTTVQRKELPHPPAEGDGGMKGWGVVEAGQTTIEWSALIFVFVF